MMPHTPSTGSLAHPVPPAPPPPPPSRHTHFSAHQAVPQPSCIVSLKANILNSTCLYSDFERTETIIAQNYDIKHTGSIWLEYISDTLDMALEDGIDYFSGSD